MLKQTLTWTSLSSSPSHLFPHLPTTNKNSFIQLETLSLPFPAAAAIGALKVEKESVSSLRLNARRRVAYNEDHENGDEEYGYNAEIAMLEIYTQSTRNEVLLVTAIVDGEEVQVLIFKGFSSCLSYSTSPDPSRSVLPARAVIKNIDRVKGPFNPSNVEYIEKGLTWEVFKNRIGSNPNN